jgi:hypothetical protein
MKQKLIQLILILQFRIGEIMGELRETLDEGTAEPPPSVAAELNSAWGQMQALLWALRELSGGEFLSLVENMGMKAEDEEITKLTDFDRLIASHGHLAGAIAHTSLKMRGDPNSTHFGGE